MARQAKIPYNGTDYTLGFTLATVKAMEQQGFVASEISTKPTVRLPELFYGAFQANHRGIKRNLVDEIWKHIGKKDELALALAEMYLEAQDSIIEDGGNGDWTLTE